MTVTIDNNFKINFAPDSVEEEIMQNLKIILQTLKNSVPLNRDFGLSGDFIDKPVQVAETLLIAEITDEAAKYEPRAEITNISFLRDEESGRLIPQLEVTII
jgi:hypothetical protein